MPAHASLKRPLAAGVVLVVVTLACLPGAYYEAFSTFNGYDDEGHQLEMLDATLHGEDLYAGPMRLLYGPMLFIWEGSCHALGMPVTHAGLRWLTIFQWVITAGLLGWGVFRLTDRMTIALGATLLCFVQLECSVHEPGHVQGFVFLTIAVMLIAVGGRARSATGWAGLCAAILVMCKINSGVFVILALGLTFAAMMRAGRARSTLLLLTTAFGAALPVVLMRPHLTMHLPLTVATMGGVLLLGVSTWRAAAGDATALRILTTGIGAFLAAIAAILLTAWFWFGVSPVGPLLNVIAPQRMVASWFWLPPAAEQASVIVPVAAGLVSGGLWIAGHKGALERRAGLWLLQIVRLALVTMVAIYVCWPLIQWWRLPEAFRWFWRMDAYPPGGLLMLSLCIGPLSWLLLSPTMTGRAGTPSDTAEHHDSDETIDVPPPTWSAVPARVFLAAMAIFNTLYLYPVAGAQTYFSTLLFIVIAAVLLHDACRVMIAARPGSTPARYAIPLLLVLTTGLLVVDFTRDKASQYAASYPVALPGSGPMRLPESRVAATQWLVYNLREHSSVLAGVPGQPSIRYWSGVKAPRPVFGDRHFGGVFWRWITPDEQRQIVSEWNAADRLLAYVDNGQISRWPDVNAEDTEIGRYILRDLKPVAAYQNYELRRRPADPDPVLTWQAVWTSTDGANTTKPAAARRLILRLPKMSKQLAAVTIGPLDRPARYDSRDTSGSLVIRIGDADTGVSTAPISLDKPQQVELVIAADDADIEPLRDVVRLIDAEGRQFGSVPVIAAKP
ncbi:MAG: hypothetical protein GC159_05710 [Phycisphaera sp.]|nr:hypothetical protein [Phycisphaera sp.]